LFEKSVFRTSIFLAAANQNHMKTRTYKY